MFAIDPDDPTPLYAQLERAVRGAVLSGRLRVGDRLPTVRQLAVDLRINANTVARVYGELERAGVLETRRGVGTFIRDAGMAPVVAPDPQRDRRFEVLVERFLAEAAALGIDPHAALDRLRQRIATHP